MKYLRLCCLVLAALSPGAISPVAHSSGGEIEATNSAKSADQLFIQRVLTEQYPELAKSTGIDITIVNPANGSDCEDVSFDKSSESTNCFARSRVLTSSGQTLHPTRNHASALVYFEPYRIEGTRTFDSFATCTARFVETKAPRPLNWACRAFFRQHAQLRDQDCPVLLEGDMKGELTDADLRLFKKVGLAELTAMRQVGDLPLLKAEVTKHGRVFAVFGDQKCSNGLRLPIVSFKSAPDVAPGKSNHWVFEKLISLIGGAGADN
ncbi:MAG: hypothetical protein AAGI88_18805 [Pseudomonadota bacterium]